MKKYRFLLWIAIAVVLIFLATSKAVLYTADMYITDHLYAHYDGPEPNIYVIGIDEETISEYGNLTLWSRDKIADLINLLYEDEENAPAVVALDLMFVGDFNEVDDAKLVEACKGRNVVVATNVVKRGELEEENGKKYFNKNHIYDIEMPYEALRNVVTSGFTNPEIAPDGYVRYAKNTINVPLALQDKAGKTQDSFAYSIYKKYMEETGGTPVAPDTDSLFQFMYAGTSGEYSQSSLVKVLDGVVNRENFKDAIVIVGAYAPGTQDSYQATSDRDTVMYGCEIHANIVQAYMNGRTMLLANKYLMAAITSLIFVLFILLFRKKVLYITIPVSFVIAGAYALTGRILSGNGICIPCIYLFVSLALADLYFIFEKYILELLENLRYQEEIKEQMWSFTEAMATAIDERTPYNASHTRNVAKYSGMIADYINKLHEAGEEEEVFSTQRKEQLVMGALLHDIGKLAIPLEVMNKETRLDGREKGIEDRLNTFRLKKRIAMLEGKIDEEAFNEFEDKTTEAVELINKVNGMGFVNDELREQLKKVLAYEYEDTDGNKEPFFTDEEKECLSIVKGTLTDGERKIMQSHVEITGRILSKVHFNKYFADSPDLAIKHHECLNGKGYPKGLTADDLNTDARIIAVADIYDALVADDRPYKRPIPREKAFDIMRGMVKDGNIDGRLVEYLYKATEEALQKPAE